MILVKYIIKDILKNQLIISIILFLVCICQKLIRMLRLVTDDNISIYLILLYLGLNIPEIGKLIVPFGAFFSVLMTVYRLHIYNEIIAMYSCAISKYTVIRSILGFSIIIAIFSGINVLWLSPYCARYQNNLLYEIRKNISLTALCEKEFHSLINGCVIFFSDKIQDKKMNHVFLVKKDHNKNNNLLEIMISEQGDVLNNSDGSKFLILTNGLFYTMNNKQELYEDVWVAQFSQYQILIDNIFEVRKLRKGKESIDHMSMYQLWYSVVPEAIIEFHWRLTLLVSVFFMPIIAVASMLSISQNYFLNISYTTMLYIVFFLLHAALRSYALLERINPMIWVWLINIVYLLIALILSMWNTAGIKRVVLRRT